jgi:hypothetical protein
METPCKAAVKQFDAKLPNQQKSTLTTYPPGRANR